MNEVVVSSLSNLRHEVRYGEGQTLITDEPASVGGDGAGPDPFTLILAALGSCISMTLLMYARRKDWPLERVSVRLSQQRVHAKDCADCGEVDDAFIHRIEHSITLEGALTDEQQARLREIARRCPVHKTLTSSIHIAGGER